MELRLFVNGQKITVTRIGFHFDLGSCDAAPILHGGLDLIEVNANEIALCEKAGDLLFEDSSAAHLFQIKGGKNLLLAPAVYAVTNLVEELHCIAISERGAGLRLRRRLYSLRRQKEWQARQQADQSRDTMHRLLRF